MPPTEPLALRYQRFLHQRPTLVAWVAGLVAGLLFGLGMGIFSYLYLGTGALGSVRVPLALVFGLFGSVPFGAAMGIFIWIAQRNVALPPPESAEAHPASRARLRASRRLLRRGAAADDPTTAGLVVWQARQMLRWQQRTPRWLSWAGNPVWQALVAVLMLLMWGSQFVLAWRAEETAEALFWGCCVLLGVSMFVSAPLTALYRRRARRALAANVELAAEPATVPQGTVSPGPC
ncbi:hypothetical protein F4561_001055 [Lipingzhangella halophila]|uniref:Uncharacterized protein n=1 Tax=Lipingzhangella halophila TaxID=1783352 RepID=A0A7W7RE05_9ACTN|nr:hypothetical protein [Lipingzhangella halophila]MBB4930235.1 hypothetical protein [Lipingzhangella halophila]